MAPPSLQGLNIIHPPKPPSRSISGDLSTAAFPDLTAQLDLWTHLAFDSDEPVIHVEGDNDANSRRKRHIGDDDDDEDASSPGENEVLHENHINVVAPQAVASPAEGMRANTNSSDDKNAMSESNPSFDINSFLAGFGIDPFSLPPLQQSQPSIAPSLAQLLALNSASGVAFPSLPHPAREPSGRAQEHSLSTDDSTPAKRARTRRVSISSSPTDSVNDRSSSPNTTTPISAAEDKRRRNTAASARFRLKKKEREVALESRAKELEGRVHELERECEGLRRENGWLKGLVVGVTGASTAQPPPPLAGAKRAREDSRPAKA